MAESRRRALTQATRRRTVGVFRYLRSEQRTLRQGFVALLVSTLAAFVAGIALASITGTLQRIPGLLILIPAAVAMRGTIFGAMAARLGTATHVGVFEVSRSRTGVLYQNLFAAVVQTLTVSLYVAVLAKGAASIVGLPSASFLTLATISMVGGVLSSALLLALTIGLSVVSYRRGYDLDTVATPLITAVGDMFSVPLLFAATFLVDRDGCPPSWRSCASPQAWRRSSSPSEPTSGGSGGSWPRASRSSC